MSFSFENTPPARFPVDNNAEENELRRQLETLAEERRTLREQDAHLDDEASPERRRYAETGRLLRDFAGTEAIDAIARGDVAAKTRAIIYLETNPLCADSGFVARDLAKALRAAELDTCEIARIRRLIRNRLEEPLRDEFKYLRQLALRIADEAFVLELDATVESADLPASENARALARYITGRWESETTEPR